jgi:hypothetical protein
MFCRTYARAPFIELYFYSPFPFTFAKRVALALLLNTLVYVPQCFITSHFLSAYPVAYPTTKLTATQHRQRVYSATPPNAPQLHTYTSPPIFPLAKGSFFKSSRHLSSAGAQSSQVPPSLPDGVAAATGSCYVYICTYSVRGTSAMTSAFVLVRGVPNACCKAERKSVTHDATGNAEKVCRGNALRRREHQ